MVDPMLHFSFWNEQFNMSNVGLRRFILIRIKPPFARIVEQMLLEG